MNANLKRESTQTSADKVNLLVQATWETVANQQRLRRLTLWLIAASTACAVLLAALTILTFLNLRRAEVMDKEWAANRDQVREW